MPGESTRTQGIARTVRLIADLLAGRSHTRASAARLLQLQPPAAARQLEAIEAHLPGIVSKDRRGGRRYSFDRSITAEPSVSLGAAISACFGASLAPLFEGTTYAIDMRDATKRIVDKAARVSDFGDVDRKFVFHARGGEIALREGNGLLDDVVEALLTSNWLRITYQRFVSSVETLDIRPVSLIVYEHQLYVVGLEEGSNVHPYRFARIRNVVVSSKTFPYPGRHEYDPAALLRDSIGIFMDPEIPVINVKVRLTGRWRTYAETHRWHASQRCELCPDGSTIVHLRVRQCSELERWILGFGEGAEILAPDELRHAIAEHHRNALARYDRTDSRSADDPAIR